MKIIHLIHPVTTVKDVVHIVEELGDIQAPIAYVEDVVELVKCQINFN